MFEIAAPAKVNLTLRVLRRRDDGFHEIETLIAPVALADRLTFTEAPEFSFSCDDPTVPGDDTNLVVRAAKAFFAAAGLGLCLAVHLEKRIPHGAGLGGGSSDAAATLRALNGHFAGVLTEEKLAGLAAALGSDVPVFLQAGAAWCRGRGEVVEPAEFRERLPLLLLKPGFGVPTPWAYRQWRDSQPLPGVSYAAQRFAWGELVNDLERPVFQKYLVLAEMKQWLLAQPEAAGALMSGSGAAVFALLREAAGAEGLAARARERFGDSLWVCATETACP